MIKLKFFFHKLNVRWQLSYNHWIIKFIYKNKVLFGDGELFKTNLIFKKSETLFFKRKRDTRSSGVI